MRKHKTIKIDDREITIKELRVKDLIDIFSSGDEAGLMDRIRDAVPLCLEGISADDLQMLAPSEMETLWDAFREVNAVFFGVAQKVGLNDILISRIEMFRNAIMTDISGLPAA